MKLFIGGEMGPWPEAKRDEIEKQILSIHKSTRKPLEDYLKDKDYGSGVIALYIIPMIFRPDIKLYKERMQYNSKKSTADYRLKIDYNNFVNVDEEGKRKLMIENILQVVKLIGEKTQKKNIDFNSEKLELDIRKFLKYNG